MASPDPSCFLCLQPPPSTWSMTKNSFVPSPQQEQQYPPYAKNTSSFNLSRLFLANPSWYSHLIFPDADGLLHWEHLLNPLLDFLYFACFSQHSSHWAFPLALCLQHLTHFPSHNKLALISFDNFLLFSAQLTHLVLVGTTGSLPQYEHRPLAILSWYLCFLSMK